MLRPFGMGNPQPTLLVPAARFEQRHGDGRGEGALPLHPRHRRRRHAHAAWRSARRRKRARARQGASPRHRAPAGEEPLERRGRAPRDPARALPDRAGRDRGARRGAAVLGRPAPALSDRRPVRRHRRKRGREDRRREGFAGVAGDLFSSGERVLVAVADVRAAGRSGGLVAGAGAAAPCRSSLGARSPRDPGAGRWLSSTWSRSTRRPAASSDPLLNVTPRAHLAWGPAEAEFALAAYRADPRPETAAHRRYRRRCASFPRSHPVDFEAALRGRGATPRSRRLRRLLTSSPSSGLVEVDLEAPSCRILEAVQSDLELSPAYRAAKEELEATERALAAELPQALPAAATG